MLLYISYCKINTFWLEVPDRPPLFKEVHLQVLYYWEGYAKSIVKNKWFVSYLV